MAGQRITQGDLNNRFTYHPPTVEQGNDYVKLRQAALSFATLIVQTVPPGRQCSLAITAVEEAVMRANAAIAQDTPGESPGDPEGYGPGAGRVDTPPAGVGG